MAQYSMLVVIDKNIDLFPQGSQGESGAVGLPGQPGSLVNDQHY